MDGTGSSGINLDLSKMQMLYLDYSWYGAGFIRWGFRGNNGDVVYCHKLMNNNVNYEAYMRSGNLPARYEVATFPKDTLLRETALSTDNTIYVNDTLGFAPVGSAVIKTANAYEYISYTSLTSNTLIGVTRGQRGNTACLVTATVNNPVLTVLNTSGLQIGQYVKAQQIPPNAFVSNIAANTTVTLTQAPIASGTFNVAFAPMGLTAQTFTYSAATPIAVEHLLAYFYQRPPGLTVA
jgi:hypothetical protein